MSETAARSIDSNEGMASERRPGGGFSPARRLLLRILARLSYGSLSVVLPGGARLDRRGPYPGPEASILLHRWRALWRLLAGGDIGFAEAYMEGDWSSPDLAAVIELPADRRSVAFELRPEARFHDGKPVTAEDVAWTFNTLRE